MVGAGSCPAGFSITAPDVQTDIAWAVFTGEQPDLPGLGEHGLGVVEQQAADAVPLAVGRHHQPPELDRLPGAAQTDRSDPPAAITDTEGRDIRRGQLG